MIPSHLSSAYGNSACVDIKPANTAPEISVMPPAYANAIRLSAVKGSNRSALTELKLYAYSAGETSDHRADPECDEFDGTWIDRRRRRGALDKWLGINGNWFLLFGGAILIVTLIQNPEGVAGAFYRRIHKRQAVSREGSAPAVSEARRQAGVAQSRQAARRCYASTACRSHSEASTR